MRITELFTAQSIALDEALQTQEQILSRLVELQATHGNICLLYTSRRKDHRIHKCGGLFACKKLLYPRRWKFCTKMMKILCDRK